MRFSGVCACVLAAVAFLPGPPAAAQSPSPANAPAPRVVSLSPHLTELLYEAGGGPNLVGAVRGSDWPPEAAAAAPVGDASGLDYERILALRPDVVLAWSGGNRRADLEKLRGLGLRVLLFEPRRLEDIAADLRRIGRAAGRPPVAEVAALQFESRLAGLAAAYRARAPVRVLIEVWHRPLITVNALHPISSVIELCGGRNVFGALPVLSGEVSREMVVAADPDAIVTGAEVPGAGVEAWKDSGTLRAAEPDRVLAVPADLLARQTSRILEGAERICRHLERVRALPGSPRLRS